MKPHKLRDLSDAELHAQEREVEEQVFRLRIQAAAGQSEPLRKLRSLKKDRARVKTILRERRLTKEKAGAGAVPAAG